MSTREQAMVALLNSSNDIEVGNVSADSVRDVLDCGPVERGAATWIPKRRYRVPVEALQRIWRGRRGGGIPE